MPQLNIFILLVFVFNNVKINKPGLFFMFSYHCVNRKHCLLWAVGLILGPVTKKILAGRLPG
jgi:hypothetical protein